jgi:putative ABC transport system permease protein
MKGLKTYFTYLHRNKLFTLVNVAGLGISLMFVLLIANMVVRQLTVGSDIKDIEHIYVLSNEEYSASNYLVGERLANRYPEMADWCAVNAEACNSGSYAVIENRKTSLEIYCVKDNFLRFFGYSLLSGNPEQALVDAHSIVLTESAARKLFGDEPAEGKMLRLSADKKDMYTVTGIIKDFDNSVIPYEVEAIVPFDYVDLCGQIEGASQHGYGESALYHIQCSKVHRLGFPTESAFHHIQRMVVRKQNSRYHSGQQGKQNNAYQID